MKMYPEYIYSSENIILLNKAIFSILFRLRIIMPIYADLIIISIYIALYPALLKALLHKRNDTILMRENVKKNCVKITIK